MTAALFRRVAVILGHLATLLLPPALRQWGEAMRCETAMIESPVEAAQFALGCVGSAACARMCCGFMSLRMTILANSGGREMDETGGLVRRPRRVGVLCAISATALGLMYLGVAGAPENFLATNMMALLIGLLGLGLLGGVAPTRRIYRVAGIALACALLLSSQLGITVNGATRWVSLGGLIVQPSLLIVPLLTIGFARSRDGLATIALIIAAVALALQPDRAMAGALAAGLLVLALLRPEKNVLIALLAAGAAFGTALFQADAQAAIPYVDQVYFNVFVVHPLAGFAVVAGTALLILPALVGMTGDPDNRVTYSVFGAVWLAVILAAAIGNYPTPVVGYGGSAVLGYVLSLMALPVRTCRAARKGGQSSVPSDVADLSTRLRVEVLA